MAAPKDCRWMCSFSNSDDIFRVKVLRSNEDLLLLCSNSNLGRGVGSGRVVQDRWKGLCLALCFDEKDVIMDELYCQNFFDGIREVVLNELESATSLRVLQRLSGCYMWNISAFPRVRQALEKEDQQPLLLVLLWGEVVDIFRCNSLPLLTFNLPESVPFSKGKGTLSHSHDGHCVNHSDGSSPHSAESACLSPSTARGGERCSIPLMDRAVLTVLCQRLGAPNVAAILSGYELDTIRTGSDDLAPSSLSRESEVSGDVVVNIASLVELGKRVLRNGKPLYAEKILLKALHIVDELVSEVLGELNEGKCCIALSKSSFKDLLQTQATVLAWVSVAQMVQGKHGDKCDESNHGLVVPGATWSSNPFVIRLVKKAPMLFSSFLEPKNEVLLALSLNKLLAAASTTPIVIPKSESLLSNETGTDSPYSCTLSEKKQEHDNNSSWKNGEYVAGVSWSSNNPSCTQTWLREYLSKNPTDIARRRQLLITLFLAGDLERFFTEIIKLKSLGDGCFVDTVMCIMRDFCGKDDPMIAAVSTMEL